MSDRIDELLRAVPEVLVDHPLDQLEPQVWRRIEARRASAFSPGALRFQIAAAAAALVVGLAIGWMTAGRSAPESQGALYASYENAGPLARLEGGL
jgi:hypothetical protein